RLNFTRPAAQLSRACNGYNASRIHRSLNKDAPLHRAILGRRGAAWPWAVNRSSARRRSGPERHQRWRHRGSRSGRGIALTRAGRSPRRIGMLRSRWKASNSRLWLRKPPGWQRELDDVREVPLIHVRSDLELAAGHAYIAEGRNMAGRIDQRRQNASPKSAILGGKRTTQNRS